jgi:hypothetical protein
VRVEPVQGWVVPAVRPVLGRAFCVGAADRVGAAARSLVCGMRPGAWAKGARLDACDLTVAFRARVRGGVARFNVADAGGYGGARKCNLFALEVAHRAGFRVPLVGRRHGVGFPGADAMAREAGRGEAGNWASVADAWAPDAIAAARSKGACVLLVSASPGRAQGHVVVVDRVTEIVRGLDGSVARVGYVGWDAGATGARHRRGAMSLRGRGGRFDEIHLLSLRPLGDALLSDDARPGPSILDARRV